VGKHSAGDVVCEDAVTGPIDLHGDHRPRSVPVDRGDAQAGTQIHRIFAVHHELMAAVAAAREAGDSWDAIGLALGVPAEAARERYERP
jgi:hypothetical protein